MLYWEKNIFTTNYIGTIKTWVDSIIKKKEKLN